MGPVFQLWSGGFRLDFRCSHNGLWSPTHYVCKLTYIWVATAPPDRPVHHIVPEKGTSLRQSPGDYSIRSEGICGGGSYGWGLVIEGALLCDARSMDRQLFEHWPLLQAMVGAWDEIDVGARMAHSRRFFPRCLASEDIACDVDEAFWLDPAV